MNLPVTSVPRWICSNAKTPGLELPYFRDMGASGGPPDGARVVYQWTEELLVQQYSIPDRSLPDSAPFSLSPDRYESLRSAVFQGIPQITSGIDPLDWLHERMNWSGCRDAPTGLSKERRFAHREINDDHPSFQLPLIEEEPKIDHRY